MLNANHLDSFSKGKGGGEETNYGNRVHLLKSEYPFLTEDTYYYGYVARVDEQELIRLTREKPERVIEAEILDNDTGSIYYFGDEYSYIITSSNTLSCVKLIFEQKLQARLKEKKTREKIKMLGIQPGVVMAIYSPQLDSSRDYFIAEVDKSQIRVFTVGSPYRSVCCNIDSIDGCRLRQARNPKFGNPFSAVPDEALEFDLAYVKFCDEDFVSNHGMDLLKEDSCIIQYIENPSEEMQYAALTANGSNFPYCKSFWNEEWAQKKAIFSGIDITKYTTILNDEIAEIVCNHYPEQVAKRRQFYSTDILEEAIYRKPSLLLELNANELTENILEKALEGTRAGNTK